MAVRVGFEPTVDCYTYGNLANFWFKPAHPPHQTDDLYNIFKIFQNIKKTFFSSLKVLIIIALDINSIIIPKDQFMINKP